MIKFLDLQAQYQSIKPAIDGAIADVITQGAFIGGEIVTRFEQAFAKYQHAEHCLGVANGTDALEIAIEALELPPASEIIVPANSFIASSEAVTRSGHRVVFADVDPVSYVLDPEDVRRRLTPRTRALIVVHLYGHPAPMDELLAIARQHQLRVIEDCAQAHGAEYRTRRVGALGDIGAFSFYPGKNLGAYGDAGALVTNDAELAQRCRMIANHGRIDKYDHRFEGRNSRLDGLQAAILSVKLTQLESWVERRNAVARIYLDGLDGIPAIHLPGTPSARSEGRHAYHLFVVRSPQRNLLAEHLKSAGIQTGIHYPIALPRLQAYAYLRQADEPMFANLADSTLLSLPIGEHLSDSDAKDVVAAVRAFAA